MNAAQIRSGMRVLHLIGGAVVGAYIYSPYSADPTFAAMVQFGVVPLLGLSGLVMWQQARLRRWLKRG